MKTILLFLMLVCGLGNFLHAAPNESAPFRIVLKAYDGDPKKMSDYTKFSFQIETIDLRQPSEFLKLGDMIPSTRLKLVKFVFKEKHNPISNEDEDVSEITVANQATGKTAVLTFNRIVDVSSIDPVFSPARK